MNIKSLLLGSAAALAAVSGAQAADAIVAAEPEPMEYVRVCDAFGTGFFYIPGTETCLKISGEVRATLEFGDRYDDADADPEDWDTNVRTRLTFEAKNDSEIGTIGSYIRLEANDFGGVGINQAYISVGGFKVGSMATYWDDIGLDGETDFWADASAFNAASYTYSTDAFTVGFGVDDLSEAYVGEEIGLEAMASASFGPATVALYGVYDLGAEEGSIYGIVTAEIGPGSLGIHAAYSSGANVYVDGLRWGGDALEWTVAAAYAFKATDKLTITPSVSFWEAHTGDSAWGAGIMGEYALAEGLKASATVDYYDEDGFDDDWSGFVRLTRSF